MSYISDKKTSELLKLKPSGTLYHKEAKDLEYKESFNFAGIGEYLRDFAAFANNQGGYIIFGITNRPRKLVGLTAKAKEQFQSIDEERISGFINEYYSPYIDWEMGAYESDGKYYGILYVHKSNNKPVICKKDHSDKLKNGSIYYRYAGRTQVIEYAELSHIIEGRIAENNEQWVNKVRAIGDAGPSNVGILNTQKGLIESTGRSLLIDEKLIKKINFIKEGEFDEKEGAKTLKLIGDVSSIGKVEVEKIVKQRLIDEYPYSYAKLEREIKKIIPGVKNNTIQRIIRENNMKIDTTYSAYNFRNKDQADVHKQTGVVPKSVASLYNQKAIDFIVKVINNESKH